MRNVRGAFDKPRRTGQPGDNSAPAHTDIAMMRQPTFYISAEMREFLTACRQQHGSTSTRGVAAGNVEPIAASQPRP